MKRKDKLFKIGEYEYTENELYENEDDRNKISAMNELERETILAERVRKLILEKERAALIKQKSEMNNSNTNIRKKDALEEIKLRRSQKMNRDIVINKQDLDENFSSFSSESEAGEVNEDEDFKMGDHKDDSSDEDYIASDDLASLGKSKDKQAKNLKKTRSDSSSYSLSSSDEDEKKKKKESFLSQNEIERVRITRSFIEKYHEIPIFDKKMEGCFVKINIHSKSSNGGSGYLLAQIKSVVDNREKPAYMMAGRPCTKYLNVAHANQEKAIAFNIVSNSLLTEVEFRIWRDRMERLKVLIPKLEQIKAFMENIESIKNYKYSQEELNEIINRKREIKIRNKDKSINITLELSLITEEFNSAKQKYIETKDESYAKRINELLPKIENLTKMAKEREREDLEKADADRIAQINKRNVQKQKMNDIENSMLHRKKKKEMSTANPYKRRDCNPINLFDSGYLNKPIIKAEAIEEKLEEETQNQLKDEETNWKESEHTRSSKINGIIKFVKDFSEDLDEILKYKYKKSKEDQGNFDDDRKKFFQMLGINGSQLSDLVKYHNSKFEKEEYKVINLDQIEY